MLLTVSQKLLLHWHMATLPHLQSTHEHAGELGAPEGSDRVVTGMTPDPNKPVVFKAECLAGIWKPMNSQEHKICR